MQIVSSADNLHDILKPIFWENTIFLSSAEFVQRVEKIIKQAINAKHAQSVLKVKKRSVLNDVPPFRQLRGQVLSVFAGHAPKMNWMPRNVES